MRVSSSSLDLNKNFISPYIFTSSQIEMDSMATSFSSQATDWRQLLAMSAGSFAFQSARVLGLASRLGNGLSSVFALGTEVATFGAVNRNFRNSAEISGSFFEDWRRDFLHFGIMKSVGKILTSQNVFFRHGIASLGMMCGSDVTARLGWTPQEQGTFAERLIHGMAMSVAMETANHLFGIVSAHRFDRMIHSIQNKRQVSFRHPAVEINFLGQMSAQGKRSGNLELKQTQDSRKVSHWPRLLFGASAGFRIGAYVGLATLPLLMGLAEAIVHYNHSPLFVMVFIRMVQGIYYGPLFGSMLGALAGLAFEAKQISQRTQAAEGSTRDQYRQFPFLQSSEVEYLKTRIQDASLPLHLRLEHIRGILPTRENAHWIIDLLQQRMDGRFYGKTEALEKAVDLGLFHKIGQMGGGVLETRRHEVLRLALDLFPTLTAYGKARDLSAENVLKKIWPQYGERRFDSWLFYLNAYASHETSRLNALTDSAMLFIPFLGLVSYFSPYFLEVPMVAFYFVQGLKTFSRGDPSFPNRSPLAPDLLKVFRVLDEVMLEADSLTYVRMTPQKDEAKILPLQSEEILREQEDVELEKQRKLQVAARIKK